MPGCDIPETLEGFQVYSLHSAHVLHDIMALSNYYYQGVDLREAVIVAVRIGMEAKV